jgi:hypothetical protein
MLIVLYPEFVPLNAVDYSDDDHNYVEEEHAANEAEVQPSRKRKREEVTHGKSIYYNEKSKKYKVQVTMDGKLHSVRSFPTQEEAVVARDAFLRGEIVIKPAVVRKERSVHG